MSKKTISRKFNKKLTNKQNNTVYDNIKKRISHLKSEDALIATVISHMGYNIIVQKSPEHKLISCNWKQNIGYICAGDNVLITPIKDNKNAAIEAVLPRKTVIEKQNIYRGNKPFAANIDQLLLVLTHQPMLQTSLIDRYLITAKKIGIDTIIYFNKVDLLKNSSDIKHIEEIKNIYKKISNVTWEQGSTLDDSSLSNLKSKLDKKKTVITGQSGVGKSSLINTLIPDIKIQTMSISEASGLGKHSTTNSIVYHLKSEQNTYGFLVDTPGVRSFDTYHLSKEDIINGFTEISPFIGYCKFSNCSHIHEDNCAIKNAVSDNHIHKIRYNSFLQILEEVTNHE